jgi:hypothetical protein
MYTTTFTATQEAVLFANEEIDIEVKVDKTKYVVMSGKQNAGQCRSIRLGVLFPGKFHIFESHEQINLHERKITNK